MNPQIDEYKTVWGQTSKALDRNVNKLISAGWDVVGGVAMNGCGFYQAMVKYKPHTNTENNQESI